MWERLQECYGPSEALEKVLFDRLESFPRITNKDPHLLRELGDLLSEIDSANSGGHIPGLLYLDTSCVIHPIVDKLPFGLQEKWMTSAKLSNTHRSYFIEDVRQTHPSLLSHWIDVPLIHQSDQLGEVGSYGK